MSKFDFLADCARIDRRAFLAAGGSLAAAAVWSSRALGVTRRNVALSDYPFKLGVASGDPSTDGFVIWTRLAPQPLEDGGMPQTPIEVSWQVAHDEQMTQVVRKGTTVATPDWAHTVHVEVDGLEPDRWYWYQFKAAGETSPKGRSRTLPPLDKANGQFRFSLASCQHYEAGHYTAYEHMAREELDMVVHVGDYIYEGPGKDGLTRKHVGGKLTTLSDFRNRYAQYKTDPALQQMHALAPWMVTWDDHEIENDWAGENPQHLETKEAFAKLRVVAAQAYYEHMPLRRTSLPDGPNMRIYRKISFGQIAELFLLDTRQYRTRQPCGFGLRPPCDDTYSPRGTMLGAEQREWLLEGLGSSTAAWNAIAQQVIFARVDHKPGPDIGYNSDKWAGYEFERRRLLKFLDERKIGNAVVLTGDAHHNWANELQLDPDDPHSKVVATEFVGTSISSGRDGKRYPKYLDTLVAENPFVKFHNEERGYVRCTLTPNEWRTDFQCVEYITRPGAPLATRATFTLEKNRPSLDNKVIDQS